MLMVMLPWCLQSLSLLVRYATSSVCRIPIQIWACCSRYIRWMLLSLLPLFLRFLRMWRSLEWVSRFGISLPLWRMVLIAVLPLPLILMICDPQLWMLWVRKWLCIVVMWPWLPLERLWWMCAIHCMVSMTPLCLVPWLWLPTLLACTTRTILMICSTSATSLRRFSSRDRV